MSMPDASTDESQERHGMFTTPTGADIFWRERGKPDGVPTLWIHGGSVEDSSMMVRDLEPFFGFLRVILPDARGHGRSARFETTGEYGWGPKCADVAALLDHLGVAQAIWGGNSMGAALSLWAGIHHPHRVQAIIDISGPPAATQAPDQRFWAEHRNLIEDGRFGEYYAANILRRSGADALAKLQARPDRFNEVVDLLHRHSVASFLALLDETFARGNWLDDCAAIQCPTLVIGGSEDVFPDVAQTTAVARLIVRSTLHIVEGGPHFPNRTHRAEVQSVISSFLLGLGIGADRS